MKLLQDFLRLRTAGRFSFSERRKVARQPRTVTVPQPLSQQREQADDTARTSRHLSLLSSH